MAESEPEDWEPRRGERCGGVEGVVRFSEDAEGEEVDFLNLFFISSIASSLERRAVFLVGLESPEYDLRSRLRRCSTSGLRRCSRRLSRLADRLINGLPSRLLTEDLSPGEFVVGLAVEYLEIVGLLIVPSLPILLRRWDNSSSSGLDSRLWIPRRWWSSSICGLPSLLIPLLVLLLILPILGLGLLLTLLLRDFLGVLSRLRQLSKHSAQEGRPMRSTMGAFPMFLWQASQLKQPLCQKWSAAWTKPPSALSARTGREHVGHVPFDPPLVVKQGRQRNLGEVDGDEGIGSG